MTEEGQDDQGEEKENQREEEKEEEQEEREKLKQGAGYFPFPNISSRTEEDSARKKVGNDIPPTSDA